MGNISALDYFFWGTKSNFITQREIIQLQINGRNVRSSGYIDYIKSRLIIMVIMVNHYAILGNMISKFMLDKFIAYPMEVFVA